MGKVAIKTIQEFLDHSDISIILVYSHVSKEYRKKALEKLSGLLEVD